MRQTISAGTQILIGVVLAGSALADGDRTGVVLGSLLAVVGALTLSTVLWPDRTVIDGEGVRLPRIWGVARRVSWLQVETVQPARYPAGKSMLVLTDGSRRALRYVPMRIAEDLATRLRSVRGVI